MLIEISGLGVDNEFMAFKLLFFVDESTIYKLFVGIEATCYIIQRLSSIGWLLVLPFDPLAREAISGVGLMSTFSPALAGSNQLNRELPTSVGFSEHPDCQRNI